VENKKEPTKTALKDRILQHKLTLKLWLQKYIVMASLGFIGLNAFDGYLTNQAHQFALQSGIQRTIEANPFLAPIAGHWAMSFKGVLGLAAIGVLSYVRKFSPRTMFWVLMLGCLLFIGVIFWNLHSMGWLRW